VLLYAHTMVLSTLTDRAGAENVTRVLVLVVLLTVLMMFVLENVSLAEIPITRHLTDKCMSSRGLVVTFCLKLPSQSTVFRTRSLQKTSNVVHTQ